MRPRASTVVSPLLAVLACGMFYACGSDSTPIGAESADANIAADTGSTPDANREDSAPALDAGTDAPLDSSTPDSADSGPVLNGLYANIGGKLVSVDVVTGAVSEIGPTGFTYLPMAWDNTAKVARVIVDNYSPANGAATPKLGTINLCTGAITLGPNIAVGATQVRRAEGLAQDPATGTFYITVGPTGTGVATEFISGANGTIDVATGAVTILGNHKTLQDDGDYLAFIDGSLYLLDVATNLNQGALYTLNKTTGAATKVVDVGPKVLRMTQDPTRNLVFGLYGETNFTARGVGTLNIATGVLTKVGSDISDALFPGASFGGLVSAPKPVCP